MKNCLDCARLRSSADKRLVGAFAQQQLKRADYDRFSGARFAGDGGETRRDFPFQIFNQRQILDS